MPSNDRSHGARAALPSPWLVATAATVGILAVLALLLLRAPAGSAAPAANSTVVSTASSSLGRVLVNSRGHTLYLLSAEKNGKSSCNGMCTKFWPPLIAAGKLHAAAGAKASLLGRTKRADGRMQVTYNRHPVYTFVKDTKKGQTNGEGVNGFGGIWDAISPAGTAVQKRTDSDAGGYGQTPLKASVLSPGPGDSAGVGGTFSVDLSLEATTPQSNNLLAGYTAAFNDPNAPTFHPGPDAAAPGLVVLLSTTPTIAGTPLQGPNTNLAASSRSTTSRRGRTAGSGPSTAGSSPPPASSARQRRRP